MKYEEVLQEFHHMVYPKSGENFISRQNTLSKDNTLVWLLLQLFRKFLSNNSIYLFRLQFT